MDQHQVIAYIYIGLSILYVLAAIGLVKWVRNERERMFHDVNKLIGDSISYHTKRKKVRFFKISPPPEPEIVEEIPVAENEILDDECPTKHDLEPV